MQESISLRNLPECVDGLIDQFESVVDRIIESPVALNIGGNDFLVLSNFLTAINELDDFCGTLTALQVRRINQILFKIPSYFTLMDLNGDLFKGIFRVVREIERARNKIANIGGLRLAK